MGGVGRVELLLGSLLMIGHVGAGGPDASLHGLAISAGTLYPPFASKTKGYTVSAASLQHATSLTVTPNAGSTCVISIDNGATAVGKPSAPIALTGKPQTILIRVYAPPKSGCSPPCTRTAQETYMIVVNAESPPPSPSPAPGPGFVPTDTDCIKWVKVNDLDSDTMPGVTSVAGHQGPCSGAGAPPGVWGQLLCMTMDGSSAGHVDYSNASAGFACPSPRSLFHTGATACYLFRGDTSGAESVNEFYLATKGNQDLNWTSQTVGNPVPTNAYRINGSWLVARGAVDLSRQCHPAIPHGQSHVGCPDCCQTNVMPGYVSPTGGMLGTIKYEDYGDYEEDNYEVATCHPPTHLPYGCNNSTLQCTTVPVGTAGSYATQQDCLEACVAPPPPPPPLSTNPCIRFGHTIPVEQHVDVEISQDPPGPPINHTWTNYKFSDFSDWVNVFKPGTGTITVWENIEGSRGAQLYQLKGIPLTPGPLMVVIKVAASQVTNTSGYWPPSLPDAVETIAASFVQPQNTTAKVRLFNLSPDTQSAGMSSSTNGDMEIVKNVAFSLGSSWVDTSKATATYTILDDTTTRTINSRSITPPAFGVWTNMLIGLQKSGKVGQQLQVVPLVDAPEGGRCHP